MLNGTQNKILNFLLDHQDEPKTIRAIARDLKKPYALIYHNIHTLEKIGIIKKQDIPPASLINIKKNAPKSSLINVEQIKKEEFLSEHIWMKVFLDDLFSYTNQKFFILLVFGSYAKKEQTIKSDLDLLIIVQKKEDIKELENSIMKIYTKVKKSLIIVTINDFEEMIKNKEEFNVGNEAIKHHVILYGIEIFYELTR